MTEAITLYGYTTSPYVRKVSAYLYYKELSFTFVGVSPVEPWKTVGFTNTTQVPVLKIGNEWRHDSSLIGAWLDVLYPAKPLMGHSTHEHAKIIAIDTWTSEQFIPGMVFRAGVDAEMNDAFTKRAWRLADIVSSATPLPDEVKKAWPGLLKKAPFIKTMMERLDLTETLQAMQMRLIHELIEHLGAGPFLGGLETPSLADFAVYPQLMFPYQVGLTNTLPFGEHPTLRPWLESVSTHLPRNAWCLDESMIINPWPFQ